MKMRDREIKERKRDERGSKRSVVGVTTTPFSAVRKSKPLGLLLIREFLTLNQQY